MSYQLHIERDIPIPMNGWLAAVAPHATLRADASGSVVSTPTTGENIVVPGKPGDVSILVDDQWVKFFRWTPRRISFKAPAQTCAANPVMALALSIAADLAACVRGDEGELYAS